MKRVKSAIKYGRMHPPRPHSESSFRHLVFDEDNNATISTVLGVNRELKCGTSDALSLLARNYYATCGLNWPKF